MKKKPVVLSIFGHPDDESFGPGGTLHILSKTHDVFLVCVTDGHGQNIKKNLAQIRHQELLAAARILGIKEVFFLGYQDGSLCHNLYHEIASKIQKYVH